MNAKDTQLYVSQMNDAKILKDHINVFWFLYVKKEPSSVLIRVNA